MGQVQHTAVTVPFLAPSSIAKMDRLSFVGTPPMQGSENLSGKNILNRVHQERRARASSATASQATCLLAGLGMCSTTVFSTLKKYYWEESSGSASSHFTSHTTTL